MHVLHNTCFVVEVLLPAFANTFFSEIGFSQRNEHLIMPGIGNHELVVPFC